MRFSIFCYCFSECDFVNVNSSYSQTYFLKEIQLCFVTYVSVSALSHLLWAIKADPFLLQNPKNSVLFWLAVLSLNQVLRPCCKLTNIFHTICSDFLTPSNIIKLCQSKKVPPQLPLKLLKIVIIQCWGRRELRRGDRTCARPAQFRQKNLTS